MASMAGNSKENLNRSEQGLRFPPCLSSLYWII